MSETIENEIVKSEVVLDEIEEEQVLQNAEKKMKKHAQASLLREKAKSMVDAADEQTLSCQNLLESDLKDYARAKEELKLGGLNDCLYALDTLGHRVSVEEHKEDELVFETGAEVESIKIEEIKTAKFGSTLLAVLSGLATFVGLVYVATEKLGMTLDISKVPSGDTTEKILLWFSSLVGSDNASVGAGLLALATLLVMLLVYSIKNALKASKNLNLAQEELLKAESYIEKKYDCKLEMDKVDTHMKDAINTLKTYEILLNEQKGKLQRIYHVEGEKEGSDEYHAKSFLEIKETKDLIATLKEFLAVSMSEEGKLSGKSTLFLHRAKNYLDKVMERRY